MDVSGPVGRCSADVHRAPASRARSRAARRSCGRTIHGRRASRPRAGGGSSIDRGTRSRRGPGSNVNLAAGAGWIPPGAGRRMVSSTRRDVHRRGRRPGSRTIPPGVRVVMVVAPAAPAPRPADANSDADTCPGCLVVAAPCGPCDPRSVDPNIRIGRTVSGVTRIGPNVGPSRCRSWLGSDDDHLISRRSGRFGLRRRGRRDWLRRNLRWRDWKLVRASGTLVRRRDRVAFGRRDQVRFFTR